MTDGFAGDRATHAHDAPGLDRWVAVLHGPDVVRNLARDGRRRVVLEEGAQAVLLLLGVGRVPAARGRAGLAACGPNYGERPEGVEYHSIGHGLPSNQSGMKTLYLCCSSLVARMSAPWTVWSKKPKMSKMEMMPLVASAGP